MARARGTSNEDTLAVNSRTGERSERICKGIVIGIHREMSEYKRERADRRFGCRRRRGRARRC